MKEKHNVILILVSSKRLILYSGGSSNSRFEMLYLSFRSSKLSLYLVAKLHLIIARLQSYSFHPSCRLIIILFTGVLHGGSTWWFIKDLFPSRSFSLSFFSKELKLSSSCNPECISFYHIIGGGFTSFLIFEFMFHNSQVVKNGVF